MPPQHRRKNSTKPSRDSSWRRNQIQPTFARGEAAVGRPAVGHDEQLALPGENWLPFGSWLCSVSRVETGKPRPQDFGPGQGEYGQDPGMGAKEFLGWGGGGKSLAPCRACMGLRRQSLHLCGYCDRRGARKNRELFQGASQAPKLFSCLE